MILTPLIFWLAAQSPSEHLSPYGVDKPFIILSKTTQTAGQRGDKSTIYTEGKGQPPRGFEYLKSQEALPHPGLIGIYFPTDSILEVTKRRIGNGGSGIITLKLAPTSTRPVRELDLAIGKSVDYNEWRRSAIQRAEKETWPPKEPGKPLVPKGTLVIVGGGGTTRDIAKAFIDAGGGDNGHFVMLPISMPDPIDIAAEEQNMHRMGAQNVTIIPWREQKDLEEPKVIDALKRATGIWFGGGRQWNFVDAYEGTKLPALFKDVLNRGGVIGGSSAGATIIGDYMSRGAPAGPNQMMVEGYERALGFLPGVDIDQHFSARNRFADMSLLMKTYPQFLGIGLDESTAIVVRGSTAEVLGRGKAHFYDTKKTYNAAGPDYDAYPAGSKYDLLARKVISSN